MPRLLDRCGSVALTPTPFSPVVDGDILPRSPWRALADGAAREIDLLIGHTRDESRLFTSRPGGEPTAALMSTAFDHLAPGTDRYRTAYPFATDEQRFEILHSDWLFRMPAVHLADAAHAGGARVWFYELAWSFNSRQGASHSLDFLLVFGTLGPDEVRAHPRARPAAAEEVTRVGDRMRAGWVNFAATGDPGWTPYEPRTRATRVYDSEPVTAPYPEEISRRIWSAHRFGTLYPTG